MLLRVWCILFSDVSFYSENSAPSIQCTTQYVLIHQHTLTTQDGTGDGTSTSEIGEREDKTKPLHPVAQFFLPEPGKEQRFLINVSVDLFALLVWILIVVFYVPNDFAREYWFMPFLGVLASVIAMSTSAGGGIVYFPALTLMELPARQAAGFSFATQMIGIP